MPGLELDLQKGARARLSELYARLKELRARKGSIEAEISKTSGEIANFKMPAHSSSKGGAAAQKKKKRAKEKWHAEYLCFTASSGNFVAAGRNAKQNDELVAKHLSESDLFFHADIQGAPTTILVGGKAALAAAKSGDETAAASLKEAAQWAASYSSAWKTGVAAVDVYAVDSSQVSKHAMGGYVGRGAFAIEGQREWFRATPLGIKFGLEGGELLALPALHPKKLEKQLRIGVGKTEKDEASREISALLSVKMEEVAHLLPSGKFSISK